MLSHRSCELRVRSSTLSTSRRRSSELRRKTTEFVRKTSSRFSSGLIINPPFGSDEKRFSIDNKDTKRADSASSILYSVKYVGEQDADSSESDVEELKNTDIVLHDRGDGLRAIQPDDTKPDQPTPGRTVESTETTSLKSQLDSAIVTNVSSSSFLPIGELERALTRESTESELLRAKPDMSTASLNRILERINPSWARSKTPDTDPRQRMMRIFAILVLIGRCTDIEYLIASNIWDFDLPLLSDESSSMSGDVHTTPDRKHLSDVVNWSPTTAKEFSTAQWQVLSPYFQIPHAGEEKTYHYQLDKNDVLPFLDMGQQGSAQGGYGVVTRVKIHGSHHNWRNTPAESETKSYAVKHLKSRKKYAFDREVANLKLLQGKHTHLVDLLGTFEQNGSYYMLFPWADGNLYDLWRTQGRDCVLSMHIAFRSWLAEQCENLANALVTIHAPIRPGRKSSSLFGRHGDLKPENILWFSSSGGASDHSLGQLKIADFGLTKFHTKPEFQPRRLAGTVTYRPPECDLPNPMISQAYDVWSLGCVYLEFLTWFMLGAEAVTREFPASRTGQLHSAGMGYTTQRFEDDGFFLVKHNKDMKSQVMLKPSVQEWILKLRQHPKTSLFILDFLDLIELEMLNVQARDRISSQKVAARLRKFNRTLGRNRKYGEPVGYYMHRPHDPGDTVGIRGLKNLRLVERTIQTGWRSRLDQPRYWAERVLGEHIDWGPLPPLQRRLRPSHAVLEWEYGNMTMSISVDSNEARQLRHFLAIRGSILPFWRSSDPTLTTAPPSTRTSQSYLSRASFIMAWLSRRVVRWQKSGRKVKTQPGTSDPNNTLDVGTWKECYFCVDKCWTSAPETTLSTVISNHLIADDYQFFTEAQKVLSCAKGGWLQRFLTWRSYTRVDLSKFHFLFNNSDRVKSFACSTLGTNQDICPGYEYTLHDPIDIDIHMRIMAECILQGIRFPELGRGVTTVLEGIPKLQSPPGLKKQALVSGWGFHAGQGPCLTKISAWIAAVLSFGLGFVPFWLHFVSRIDLQNAFAPGTFLATGLGVFLAGFAIARNVP